MSRTSPPAVGAAIILVLAVGVVLLYAVRSQIPPAVSTGQSSTPLTVSSPPAPPTPSASASPAPTARPGSITGTFGYPSDFIPAVTVYAISTTDARVWYSVVFPGFGNPPRATLPPGVNNPTYTIGDVSPGMYWVVAYRNDGNRPDPGYYSRQVECFRTTPSGPCPDVSLAVVTVMPGQTSSGIDVITWFPPPASPTVPPRPTPRP